MKRVLLFLDSNNAVKIVKIDLHFNKNNEVLIICKGIIYLPENLENSKILQEFKSIFKTTFEYKNLADSKSLITINQKNLELIELCL